MSDLVQALILAIGLAGMAGFVYAWFFLWKVSVESGLRWREWVSLTALGLASLAVILWCVTLPFTPAANWGTGEGVDHQIRFVEAWTKLSVRICAAGLVIGLAGRPRLILPVSFACVGTALFWIMSTIP